MRLRVCLVVCLFQPALPMRGVTGFSAHDEDILLFQPALPMRGVTRGWNGRETKAENFNPHSPCGE